MTDDQILLRRQVFKQVLDELNHKVKTKLNVVICGAMVLDPEKKTNAGLRESVKSFLTKIGDEAIFLESWIDSDEGRELKRAFQGNLSREPSLQELEVAILEQNQIDKNIHILESPGSIAELTDFAYFPLICRKCKIFVSAQHRNSMSYTRDVMERVARNGGKIFWYTNEQDLLEKLSCALKENRYEKAKSVGIS
jgi:hypothetical protein